MAVVQCFLGLALCKHAQANSRSADVPSTRGIASHDHDAVAESSSTQLTVMTPKTATVQASLGRLLGMNNTRVVDCPPSCCMWWSHPAFSAGRDTFLSVQQRRSRVPETQKHNHNAAKTRPQSVRPERRTFDSSPNTFVWLRGGSGSCQPLTAFCCCGDLLGFCSRGGIDLQSIMYAL